MMMEKRSKRRIKREIKGSIQESKVNGMIGKMKVNECRKKAETRVIAITLTRVRLVLNRLQIR